MLNVVFVNTCFTLLLNEGNNIKRSSGLYRDLRDIVDFYKTNYDIPVSLSNNIDCVLELCRLRMNNKSAAGCVDSIIQSKKYKEIESLLLENLNTRLTDEETCDLVTQVRNKRKYSKALTSYKTITGFFEQLDSGAMNSMDEAIDKYDSLVKLMYTDLMDSNRVIEIESAASIDPLKDTNTGIAQKIKTKYSRKNRVPSGYSQYDDIILEGGFSKSRVYIYGGSSGAGKSTLMLNICYKSACLKFRPECLNEEQYKVFLFITLEDQIDESYLKLYQMMFKKTKDEALTEIDEGLDIETMVTEKFKESKSTIIFKYFPNKSITPMDLNSVIDEVEGIYGKNALQLMVVDYLDLLNADVQRDALRLELGDIVLSLKTISINHSIPILVPTQLNKEAYNDKLQGQQLNAGMIGESMQKVHNADYISLQIPDGNDSDHLVHFKVEKNRAGKNHVTFSFRVDFARCLFIRATLADKPAQTVEMPQYMQIPAVSNNVNIPVIGKASMRTLPNQTGSLPKSSITFDEMDTLFDN